MPPRRTLQLPQPLPTARGEVELVIDRDHFTRIIQNGLCRAAVSLDIMTADFKAMLIPTGKGRTARSIVQVLRNLADRGVEIRLLHAGTPSGPALQQLKQGIPQNLTIRRCPRLHAKAVIIDTQWMYLGSANLTGAGLGAKGQHKRNFELGVWTCSTTLIETTLERFNALWEGHPCKSCQRHDVCPVPLEEPRL
jgi:phosphatidylserine/phosphatidylglycerophosphate/cardiolipin synthase-like enzyme